MRVCYRVSLNLSNTLAIVLGIWIVYQAHQGYIKLASSPQSDERDALDGMCFAVAIFAVASMVTNLLGSVFVNVDSDTFKLCYCVILGALALIYLVLTLVTVELIDEFEDTMTYKLYEAIIYYNQSKKNDFLDKVQTDLECCGAKGVVTFGNCSLALTNCTLPDSCCPKLGNSTQPCANSSAYEDTCELKVMYSIENNTQWIVVSMLLMAGYYTVVIALESLFNSEE